MLNRKLLMGSHAPYWHNGSSIREKSCHTMLAALPAVIAGIAQYGSPALAVVALSVSCAMLWELLMNVLMKQPHTIIDGNAAVIGLLFAMLLPATTPWWLILMGTFLAVVIGKQIYGGLGCNPLNPTLVALAMVMLSWKGLMDFNGTLAIYDKGFPMLYPLSSAKYYGPSSLVNYPAWRLLLGQQPGGIGATFGLGLIISGLYLIARGLIRWEISVSFLAGVLVTALLFNIAEPGRYAGPLFHILTGYTLISAFFLLTEDSSSPVNFIPMLIYGAGAGVMTVLIRNIGMFLDGTVFAILLMNIASPLIDKIRPRAMGKGNLHA